MKLKHTIPHAHAQILFPDLKLPDQDSFKVMALMHVENNPDEGCPLATYVNYSLETNSMYAYGDLVWNEEHTEQDFWEKVDNEDLMPNYSNSSDLEQINWAIATYGSLENAFKEVLGAEVVIKEPFILVTFG